MTKKKNKNNFRNSQKLTRHILPLLKPYVSVNFKYYHYFPIKQFFIRTISQFKLFQVSSQGYVNHPVYVTVSVIKGLN